MTTSTTCSWCHASTPLTDRFCQQCSHDAHLSRVSCRCPRCSRNGTATDDDIHTACVTTAAEAVDAFLAELQRLKMSGEQRSLPGLLSGESSMTASDFFGDPIHAYTRAQAIADGVLIDVTDLAREAGFKHPVALTASAWAAAVEVPPEVTGQDERGRLWDVLTLLRQAALSGPGGSETRFAVHVRNDDGEGTLPLVQLKAVCGPGDQGERVVTVMMLDED